MTIPSTSTQPRRFDAPVGAPNNRKKRQRKGHAPSRKTVVELTRKAEKTAKAAKSLSPQPGATEKTPETRHLSAPRSLKKNLQKEFDAQEELAAQQSSTPSHPKQTTTESSPTAQDKSDEQVLFDAEDPTNSSNAAAFTSGERKKVPLNVKGRVTDDQSRKPLDTTFPPELPPSYEDGKKETRWKCLAMAIPPLAITVVKLTQGSALQVALRAISAVAIFLTTHSCVSKILDYYEIKHLDKMIVQLPATILSALSSYGILLQIGRIAGLATPSFVGLTLLTCGALYHAFSYIPTSDSNFDYDSNLDYDSDSN